MNKETTLHNLGLSPNEAKVYLAALEMGTASAQDISHKAGVIRTTGYSILERLAIRNFVYKTKQKNKTRYVAESPKNLVHRFEHYQKELTNSLPELQAIYNKSQIKPKIVFYEGKSGIEEIYADTIKEKPREILEFNTLDIFAALPDFPAEYLAQRNKHHIYAKRIATDEKRTREHAARDKEELSHTLLLPKEEFNPPVEINIYNNKVAFMSYPDEIGIIIESHGIADTMRQIYHLLWKKLKK
ncbi:MAG: helix-turn-helix domain-containing protein [Patescibacteria group bacterium]|jgi:sugar-specific transcriptional regulator TrmB